MSKADEQPVEDLIKAGVRDTVALQQRNPTAISDGVDPHKAFKIDSPALDLSRTDSEAMKKLTESTAELDIATNEERPNPTNDPPAAGVDAAFDPTGPPSHPNLEIVSRDVTTVEDGEVDDGQADEPDGAGPDPANGLKKKKKKQKPKSKRVTVGARS